MQRSRGQTLGGKIEVVLIPRYGDRGTQRSFRKELRCTIWCSKYGLGKSATRLLSTGSYRPCEMIEYRTNHQTPGRLPEESWLWKRRLLAPDHIASRSMALARRS
jgi:hypothetical protein